MGTTSTKIITPKGSLQYVTVSGQGKLDYDGKFYEYTASIKLDKKEANKLYDEICEFFVANKPSFCKDDKPTNKIMRKQEDGTYVFQFKTKTQFPDEKSESGVRHTHIHIVNARNEEVTLPENEGIGNDSVGRISGNMTMFSDKKKKTAGVSLWLNGIKILKYIKYVPSNGFDNTDNDIDDDDADFTSFNETSNDFPEEKKAKKKTKKEKKAKK